MIGRFIQYLVGVAVMAGVLLTPTAVAADPFAACSAAGGSDSTICKNRGKDAQGMVRNIITMVLFLIGAIAVIAIIYGGFTYVTSNGDPKKVEQAKTIIFNAIIGLVVGLSASAIVAFVAGMLK